MSGRIRKANRYVQRAMCQAAWAASHTKQTYLSAFYRRMAIRKGATKAIVALAHHMLVVIYQVLSRGEEYVEMGGDYYEQRNKPKVVERLVMRLTKLGYWVDLRPAELPEPLESATVAASPPEPNGATINPKRRRGRPCKCVARGIPCKHGTTVQVNSLIPQPSSPERFS